MNYQDETLPENVVKISSTSMMTEQTILPGILKNHETRKGRYGFLVVEEGALQFVWEEGGEVLDADPGHPIVIFPEKLHHVKLTGKVQFYIEFYEQVRKSV
ncbi:hypothetical protein MNBD_NITROSPIRAE01-306 [hydrothermal vent metagenome]|uniref:TehB/YeaR-like domain-containing protein n=1 Tax=hydrothermal vent metagenome TaxID=652676 RepID=A0A3B1CSY4_9ZZZZ